MEDPDIMLSETFTKLMEQNRRTRIADKKVITIYEAAAYTGIGRNRLAKLEKTKDCNFIIYKGSKRLYVREKFVDYLEKHHSI